MSQPNGQAPPSREDLSINFFRPRAGVMRTEEARNGQEWFVQGWQDREKKLFALAGEVATKLNLK